MLTLLHAITKSNKGFFMELDKSMLNFRWEEQTGRKSQDYFEGEQGRASLCQTSRPRKLQVIKRVISINDSVQIVSVKHPKFMAKEEVEIGLGLEASLRNNETQDSKGKIRNLQFDD